MHPDNEPPEEPMPPESEKAGESPLDFVNRRMHELQEERQKKDTPHTSEERGMTSFQTDIRPLFRDVDIEHMKSYGLDLGNYQQVKDHAADILDRVSTTDDDARMPPPPEAPWTTAQVDLFRRWIADGCPS